MFGDSFCKELAKILVKAIKTPFNPHVWGLFLQEEGREREAPSECFAFNPHVWGLFLQEKNDCETAPQRFGFQSPCLGTLFARDARLVMPLHLLKLSIPMFGDSFCKYVFFYICIIKKKGFQSPCLGTLFARTENGASSQALAISSFNPHVWGLFLQEKYGKRLHSIIENFQSPCLGTLFARAEERK